MVTYETAISFRFPGGEIEQAREQAGKWRSSFGVIKEKKKMGRTGRDTFARSFGPFASFFGDACYLMITPGLLPITDD